MKAKGKPKKSACAADEDDTTTHKSPSRTLKRTDTNDEVKQRRKHPLFKDWGPDDTDLHKIGDPPQSLRDEMARVVRQEHQLGNFKFTPGKNWFIKLHRKFARTTDTDNALS